MMLPMIGFPGTTEILIITGVIVLLFGNHFIPKLAKGIGESVREIRSIGKELEEGVKELEEKN